ncbi:MAG: response regulator, partial [Bacteroidota bacterium]
SHNEYVFPDLILLDVNMPGMNGIEFLKKIKKIDDFAKIPVIILTVSEHERDILDTYELGVSAYIRKPVQADNFINVISSLQNFVLELKVRNINSEPFVN